MGTRMDFTCCFIGRAVASLGALAFIASCASAQSTKPGAPAAAPTETVQPSGPTCNAARTGGLVGADYSAALGARAAHAAGATSVRVLRPGEVHTMEFVESRLSIELDGAGRIWRGALRLGSVEASSELELGKCGLQARQAPDPLVVDEHLGHLPHGRAALLVEGLARSLVIDPDLLESQRPGLEQHLGRVALLAGRLGVHDDLQAHGPQSSGGIAGVHVTRQNPLYVCPLPPVRKAAAPEALPRMREPQTGS